MGVGVWCADVWGAVCLCAVRGVWVCGCGRVGAVCGCVVRGCVCLDVWACVGVGVFSNFKVFN